MITEDYVSIETAKLLKENGFEWIVERSFLEHDNIYAPCDPSEIQRKDAIAIPTLQIAMKWLREKNLFVEIYIPSHSDHEDTIYHDTWSFDLFNLKTKNYMYCTYGEVEYNSYEEACEAAIKYCLENFI